MTPMQIITAQTIRLPRRLSHAAHPQRHPRVVPIARRKNVITDVPIDTSVIKMSWSAAHTIAKISWLVHHSKLNSVGRSLYTYNLGSESTKCSMTQQMQAIVPEKQRQPT